MICRNSLVIALVAWRSFSPEVSAQTEPPDPGQANSRQSLLDRYDPWMDAGGSAYAPQSPGDSDLGEQLLLMPQSAYQPLSIHLSERGTWTSNAALTDDDAFDDYFSHTELGLSLVPKLLDNTYGEFTADYGLYRYAEHGVLDFDSVEAGLGVIQVMPGIQNLSAWVRYNHLRLLTGSGHDEIFTDHTIEAGLYLPISLGARQSAFANYASEFSLDGNPDFARRHEHRLMVGYSQKPTDRLELSAYYQLSLLDYIEGGRTDLLHVAGLAVTRHITEGIDLVLSGSYSLNDSDVVGGDYEVGDAGAAASIKVKF